MNKKLILFLFALGLSVTGIYAQQKSTQVWKKSATIKAFKSSMKEKNYSKAKSDIDDVLGKYDEAVGDAELYSLRADALNELIVAENRKIYLNQKPDTVKYFKLIYDMYDNGLKCENAEQAYIQSKAKKGKKQAPKYRYNVGQKMLSYRKNLLQAGKFFYKKHDYSNAYQYFDMYLDTKDSEVLTNKKGISLVTDNNDVTEISSLATLSAYASNNHKGVLKYVEESLNDSSTKSQMLEIASRSSVVLNDTVSMLNFLEEGFKCYPEKEYFFVSLVKYYNSMKQYEKSIEKATVMTKLKPSQRDYWFVKGKTEMLSGKYAEAIASFEKCVEIKADDAETYSSLGNIYLYFAHDKYNRFSSSVSDPDYASKKAEINDDYQNACNNFELAKKYDEQNTDLWLDGLREAYFKLNKGKELKKLDKYK